MSKYDFKRAYTQLIDDLEKTLKDTHSHDEIMQLAVGGSFEVVGILEREFLIQAGLQEDDYVIDVGCGSGRLARPLSEFLRGKYLGIDVVPRLIDYANQLAGRPEWRFELAPGLQIPEDDEQADLICFFSVFTHLRHEESYLYLQEARRVLVPGGKIIFSFLEFPNPHHWKVFENNLTQVTSTEPLNQFISMDAIKIWALRLGLHVSSLNRAGKITLSRAYQLQDGRVLQGTALFGQSVCVLSKEQSGRLRQKVNNGLFRLADCLQRIQV